MSQACPDESDLLAIAQNAEADAGIRGHVAGCVRCQQAMSVLRSDISTLRLLMPQGQPPASLSAARGQRPAFMGKYFVVGVLRADNDIVQYRAAHAVVYEEVIVSLAKEANFASQADRHALANAARRLISFAHPTIPRIVDFDFYGEQPYLVEKYHPGRPLSAAGKEFPPRCAALACALVAAGRAIDSLRCAGLVEFEAAELTPIVDEQEQLWLTGVAAAWLRSTTGLTDNPAEDTDAIRQNAAIADSLGHRDVQTLAAWLRCTIDPLRNRHVARFCTECAASAPTAPKDSREFASRLEKLSRRRCWPWFGTSLVSWAIIFWALAS